MGARGWARVHGSVGAGRPLSTWGGILARTPRYEREWLELFELLERFLGTLAPAARASDRPIAMACFRLVTFLPERPLLSVPCLRSCIARSTFCDAFFPYLGMEPPLARGISIRRALCEERQQVRYQALFREPIGGHTQSVIAC